MEMSGDGEKIRIFWLPHVLLLLMVVLYLLPCAHCEDGDDYRRTGNPVLLPMLTESIYKRLSNLSIIFSDSILDTANFCIKNVKADWDMAFNYNGNLDFISNCLKKTKGDITHRLCTAAEIKFYFISHFQRGATKANNYLKPNRNCNLTSWPPGCEPGWGCIADMNEKVEIENSKEMPARTRDCQPCCEGFFCPQGLTCMIPCPLGSYCPAAKLNDTTGICEPYGYQLPPGQPDHGCGSADTWSDVGSDSEMFCPPGSYCPSTTVKVPCSSGHYCMMGSTTQTSCFKLTNCGANTANQSLHAYGGILIVSLTTLLLIIVNCSDQALSTRERKEAKSREAAARHARETAQARERWKAAKEEARNRATGLQQQLSRAFSRQVKPRSDDNLSSVTSSESNQSSKAAKGNKKEPSSLAKIIRSLEDDPNNDEGFNLEIGGKKQMPKGKQLHTHSQIFKYAYGQLEKERALQQEQKNLTFSGLISRASDTDIKTRPVIEVAFKDLTLTLKGKKKHLLRCVTGKIMPGRVSAVMGPSGAGKTTFLSALAGKVTGCTMEGLILINGKNESIHSYKRIIGFVPQDDIVHGNLTVEENLRFSARCRLPDDMPKADKVLVIERVIESLGLQAIRDSLVGTVEKRGISGGQRKRVNVGLEMVMEPSLLILDEPTSGLDSASSQLLLKALRREAIEGVNICMVLHQPSYALYKMFDDLILLAKGGLTVYHGSTKKVEEYFAGLGIIVPERVTPPDHFIDILEGIIKPNGNITREQLPIRWMLHNGYPVPPDMLHHVDSLGRDTITSDTDDPNAAAIEQSFAGDLWQDVKCNVEIQKDHIQHNFLKSKDLSNRRTPSASHQFRYFLGRVTKQRLREARLQAVDYLVLLLAGACLGTLTKMDDETFGTTGYTFTVIAISLLCKIAALRSFSLDKLHYWRESASGISSLAYFLSRDTLDHFNTIVKPLVYLSMFYFFNNPRSTFIDNYIILVCLVYCVTGIAYVFAIHLGPTPAQLWSVLTPVVLTLVATQEQQSKFVKILGNFCYPKWAMEAFIIANAQRYSGVWLLTRCHSLLTNDYDIGHWSLCLELLILTGIFSRFTAYFLLITFQKK